MDKNVLEKIKNEALEQHIPIIMDDTLETLNKILENKNYDNILEIGTATRIFCNLLFKLFKRKWKN